ncbi:formate dehydrogenase N subunit beta transmembrane domain-containing protein [Neisseria weixii]|uniref:formate dehydrogenase N subunit beta transmembrane domain-containing protein n=1 Tax=Neisseria weixii TaxID=1853276 RepID=UPI0022B75A03|nr:formate dehydrogenase N subunit beta transmembrane domain-containing protein [Neisseria weixii]
MKTCPTGAIQFGSKEHMKQVAQERIKDLNSRGYQNAGLYDPQGVGGTHVMYVLHHADKPNLYNGLPENPSISPTVKVWKGLLKPLATFGIAAAAVAGWMHYITVGPNREDEDKPEVIGKDGKILHGEEDA